MEKQPSSWPEYHPLDASRKEIRLLEIILPSDDESLLECRLSTVSLVEKPSFTALSYVWGDPTLTEDVLVGSRVTSITRNLASALRHVGSHWKQQNPERDAKGFRLWADALCINQRDMAERSQQVQLMGEIYSSSELMFAWLGADNSEVDLALRTLKILFKEVRLFAKDDFNLQWMEKYPELCAADTEEEGHLGNRCWDAIWRFPRLQYWSRVWIFQELVLGAKVIFVSASQSLSLEELGMVCLWGQRLPDSEALQSSSDSKMLLKPSGMSDAAWTAFTGGYINWGLIDTIMGTRVSANLNTRHWTLLVLCSDLRATNPRDHIYGLLGVIAHGLENKLIPDYEKTIGEIYGEAFKCVVDDRQDLGFLNYSGLNRFGEGAPMPSWAPDLDQIAKAAVEGWIQGGAADRDVFKESSDAITASHSILHVDGAVLDNIEHAHLTLNPQMWLSGEMFEFCADFTSRHPTYITGVPSLKAIFHVLMNRNVPIADASNETSLQGGVTDPQDQYHHMLALGFIRHLLFPQQKEGLQLNEGHAQLFSFLGLPLDAKEFPKAFEEKVYPDCNFEESGLPNLVTDWHLSSGVLAEADWKVMVHIVRYREHYRLIETSTGYLGLAPSGSQPEDRIAILKSCPQPVVLRQCDAAYTLIGTCYILGLMGGEANDHIKAGRAKVQQLHII